MSTPSNPDNPTGWQPPPLPPPPATYPPAQYPAPGAYSPPQYGAGVPDRVMPRSVRTAIAIIIASVLVGLLGIMVSVSVVDQIIEATPGASNNPEFFKQTFYMGLGITFILGNGINLLFAFFFTRGWNWARNLFTVLAAIGAFFSLADFDNPWPTPMVLMSILRLILTVAVVALLYTGDSNRFFSRR